MTIANPIKAWRDHRFLKKHGVYPPESIRTHSHAEFWLAHGCPRNVGALITVDLTAGKQALFRLSKIEQEAPSDWAWYTFKFIRFV